MQVLAMYTRENNTGFGMGDNKRITQKHLSESTGLDATPAERRLVERKVKSSKGPKKKKRKTRSSVYIYILQKIWLRRKSETFNSGFQMTT